MKKVLIIITAVIFITLSNCKYFRKKTIEPIPVDTIQIDTIVVDTTPVDKDVYLLSEINDKYLMIIGSFETLEFAKIHAEKYKQFGLNTKVILKPDNYYMVSAKYYENKEEGKNDLKYFRKHYAKKSWIYTNQRMAYDEDVASIY